MKLSIHTFIVLLITIVSASAFAEKPEGQVKRYKVVLEKKPPTAESATDVEAQQNASKEKDAAHKKADKEAKSTPEKAEEGKSKWWKPWGNNNQETKESDKGSETGQLKREENSRKWWKLWGESDPESEDISEKPEAPQEQSKDNSKKWWKPWN